MTTLGLIIFSIISIVLYANIGYLLAHWSVKCFKLPFKTDILWGQNPKPDLTVFNRFKLTLSNWLLFPFLSTIIELRDQHFLDLDDDSMMPFIYKFNSEKIYKRTMLFVWPLKVAANAIVVIPGLIIYGIYRAGRAIVHYFPTVITYPTRKIFKINHV